MGDIAMANIADLRAKRKELCRRKLELDIMVRKASLEHKAGTGGMSSREAFFDLCTDLKKIGREINDLDHQIAAAKEQGPSVYKFFIEEVKGFLAPETFDMLMSSAEARFSMAGGVIRKGEIDGNR